MEKINTSENHGRVFYRKGDRFVVWDRDEKYFVEVGCITLVGRNSSLDHLRDVYDIARKHGVKRAFNYDWKATKAHVKGLFAEVCWDLRDYPEEDLGF